MSVKVEMLIVQRLAALDAITDLGSQFLLSICLGNAFAWMIVTILRNRATVLMLQKRLPNFKVVPAIPVFGSTYHFKDLSAEGLFTTFIGLHKLYGKTLITQSLFNFPSLHVCDAKVIAQIMQARTVEKTIIYDFMTPWLGTGLIVSTGSKWTQRRKIITPAFHFKILEDFLVIMNHQSDVLIEKLKTSANGTDCNIYNHVTYCALDIIAESAMSVKLNTQQHPNSEYVLAVKEMTDIILKRLFSLFREYKWAFQFTKAHRRQRELVKVIHDFAYKVISDRKKQLYSDAQEQQRAQKQLAEEDVYGKRRMTLLDLLLNVTMDGKPLSDSEIREEVDTFMFTGHDSTTSSISFTAYHLSRDASIQQRVYDEILAIVGPDAKTVELTYGTLQKLKYLEMVIKETLRINPPVPVIGRRSAGDMVIDGVTIPKGLDFFLVIYSLHNDPELYPEPTRFDPERFSEEALVKRPPYSYMPFSAGSRNCIGQRYAMLEVKTVLVKLLANYQLLPCEASNQLRLKTDMTLKPVNGVFVKLVRR
uniref:Cytochrome P450 n=1 Tax=Anopheles coluzzii TaxID=1518534 RepID=A0A6E8VXD3_ANOCL